MRVRNVKHTSSYGLYWCRSAGLGPMMAAMTLVLILGVTWLTLALVVMGACVVAGRADRVAFDQVVEPAPMAGLAGQYAAPIALANSVSGAGARGNGAFPAARRRGADHARSRAGVTRR